MTTGAGTQAGFKMIDENIAGHPGMRLVGALDADSAPDLSDALVERMGDGVVFHLDLAGVTFMSSAGVGSLIASVGEYRDQGGDLVMHAVPEEIMHVFELLGLEGFLKIEA